MEEPEIPLAVAPRNRFLRRSFLTIVAVCTLVLIPWIGYLVATLPSRYVAEHWRLAWVGFDVALVVALIGTGVTAWRRRRSAVPWALATGTLLMADAWFDVVLSWGTADQWVAVLAAVFAELPLAVLLFYTANRLVRLMLMRASTSTTLPGALPAVHDVAFGDLVPRRRAAASS